jgi:hypothetical protein
MHCKQWQNAIDSNSQAIEADERYLARAGALNFYSLYRSHNYHFRVYAAMFAGQFRTALDTVVLLEASLPDALLRIESPPMADWLESFLSLRVHVLIRFGKWDDMTSMKLPEDSSLYSVTTAMVHYGKGVAWAAKGEVAKAEDERRQFHAAESAVQASRTLFNNTAKDILAVASHMLDGEIEYRKENFGPAFEQLRKAVELSDNLPYDEPWGWMQVRNFSLLPRLGIFPFPTGRHRGVEEPPHANAPRRSLPDTPSAPYCWSKTDQYVHASDLTHQDC